MNYKELIITIGLMILVTLIYIICRKFIAWAIEDHDKQMKKQGRLGIEKSSKKVIKEVEYRKLTSGYLLFMGVLILYMIKLFADIS